MMYEPGRAVEAAPETIEALWGHLDEPDVGSKELTEYARTVLDVTPPEEPDGVTWLIGVAFPDDGPDRGVLCWIGREDEPAQNGR